MLDSPQLLSGALAVFCCFVLLCFVPGRVSCRAGRGGFSPSLISWFFCIDDTTDMN